MKEFSLDESLNIWENNAEFWDNTMGDNSNEFHRQVVLPKVTKLLNPKKEDFILDIACGNGNYSAYLAQNGVDVVAFDYSKKMIELAKKRQNKYLDKIKFLAIDATNSEQLMSLSKYGMYDKAVSNMAIMVLL